MKTISKIKMFVSACVLVLFVSCGANGAANRGTAHDRTGTNGATNGNGKAPSGTAHQQTTRP
ncbi:MAG TPA: hypothetical protein VGB71_16690 [Flavisolibacter sp.]